MAAPQFNEIVRKHRPRGYRLNERKMVANYGLTTLTTFSRTISCEPIVDRFALFIFLHECGHVHCRHMIKNRSGCGAPPWREEYEADMYAAQAMRAEGIPVPRECVRERKEIIRDLIKEWNAKHEYEHVDDEDVLYYAYGRNWRKHR